jgi:hypothetical protein
VRPLCRYGNLPALQYAGCLCVPRDLAPSAFCADMIWRKGPFHLESADERVVCSRR